MSQLQNGKRNWIYSSKKDIQVTNKQVEGCLKSEFKEVQIQTTVAYCFVPTRMARMKKAYFWQRSQKHTLEKRQPGQQMVWGKLYILCRRLKLNPYLSPFT
jgi:hypothetical protein